MTPDICSTKFSVSSCVMPKLIHSHSCSGKVLDHPHQEMLAGACQAGASLNDNDGNLVLGTDFYTH